MEIKLNKIFEKYRNIKDRNAKMKETVSKHDQRMDILNNQLQCLTVAMKETLADRINQKYKYYMSVEGIPEDEFDEFVNLHDAYNGVGGNHSGDKKFSKCMQLPIIPVGIQNGEK